MQRRKLWTLLISCAGTAAAAANAPVFSPSSVPTDDALSELKSVMGDPFDEVSPGARHTREEVLVPISGAWKRNEDVFTFRQGDWRDASGWIWGTVEGRGGRESRYAWNGDVSGGLLYLDLPSGRQGPIAVRFSEDGAGMDWSFRDDAARLRR